MTTIADHAWFGVHREVTVTAVLVALMLATLVAAMTAGSYATPPAQLRGAFTDLASGRGTAKEDSRALYALTVIRIPRSLLALIVGDCLVISGTAYQGLLHNPMVSPDILGMVSGASTGAILCLLVGTPPWMTQGVVFAFGLGTVAVVLLLGRFIRHSSSKLLVLVLAGVVISPTFSVFTSLIKYIADSNDKLPTIVFWLMGSFARSGSWNNLIVLVVAVLLGAILLMLLRHRMNVLSFGGEETQSMGLDVRRVRLVIIYCAMILTATIMTLCENIGWVDLILPHLMRLVIDPDYCFLLPNYLLAGGLFMLVVDGTMRILLPGEMPVGIVTSLIGAPLFICLLFQGRKDWV